MAAIVVQSVLFSDAGSTSATINISGVTAGSTLLLAVGMHEWSDTGGTRDGRPDTVVSSPTGTWTEDAFAPAFNYGGAEQQSVSVWRRMAVEAGAHSVTVTGTFTADITLILSEVSGLASSPFDTSAAATGSGASASTGPTATLAQATGLAFAAMSSGAVSPAFGTPAGYTKQQSQENGSSYVSLSVDSRVLSGSTAAQNATWTVSSAPWSALVVVYKDAVSSSASVTQSKTLSLPGQAATLTRRAALAQSTALASPVQVATVSGTTSYSGYANSSDPANSGAPANAGPGAAVNIEQTKTLAALSQTALLTVGSGVPANLSQAAVLALPSQTAALTATSKAAQAATILRPVQTATLTRQAAIQQTISLLRPTQATTVGLVASVAQSATLPVLTQVTVLPQQVDAAQTATLLLVTQTATVQTGADAPTRAVTQAATLLRPVQTATLTRRSAIAQTAVLRLPVSTILATAPSGSVTTPPPTPTPTPPFQPIEEPQPVVVTGDYADMMARLVAVLPPWWGAPGVVPPVLRLPLAMAASVGAWLYGMIAYARLQTRIKTATGGWLDLIGQDFFGNRIRRRAGQPDESFRNRILAEMFRPRATRPAMAAVLKDLTGREPRIFEPERPQDTGGIGLAPLAIGRNGAIGSIGAPGNVFIDVYRNPDAGIPFAAGIGTSVGGIGVNSRLVIASIEQIRGALTEADVYGAIEATRPAGVIVWVRLHY